jgi:two-component system, NarL family, invasion response regulator UvrY
MGILQNGVRSSALLISTPFMSMLRIIIADDHPVVMQAVKQIIQEEFPDSYIEEATDTKSLLEKALNEDWDLVVSDLAMPGGGGFLALKKIKQAKKNLPVLILSTYPPDQYRTRVLNAGAEEFICKDSLPHDLITSVRRILAPKQNPGK